MHGEIAVRGQCHNPVPGLAAVGLGLTEERRQASSDGFNPGFAAELLLKLSLSRPLRCQARRVTPDASLAAIYQALAGHRRVEGI